ncbi:PhnA protein [Sulfurimonas denitrificans DSM 1251]|jgi:protein PhnA|uniref:PhnA protein n=1 Tax=Sulfurimonas denitrificans (strain ATCC 33889 / DSM 1251) TaxID=326298 RepID=Q30UN1_SULDN|nr:alkylphosphonate utilization protein [Sulfurimonas denitrificans]ABB43300.1 PhnA protein [Sulfurimonas denitrificans DSM 1251]MDD3443336.1 PhnA domain-containing protein [Sulfurimonas denitrificans]
MSIEEELKTRSGSKCELCQSSQNLSVFEVAPSDESSEQSIYICATCKEQIENPSMMDETHFNCLNESMWSEVPAVVVISYRLLKLLGREDLVDMIYMEDDVKAWADAGVNSSSNVVVKDSNGVTLNAGDSVVIIKDLEVKGAGFTAKRGTMVKNISIPQDVEGHIEGRVNGTKIYLKTEFLKKA